MNMRKYVAAVLFYGFTLSLAAQDCVDASLAQLPGKWTAGKSGSVENVSAANLVREKALAAYLLQMMKPAYSPAGGDIVYSNVYGYNAYIGKNWMADPYEYSMYFKRYRCEPYPKNGITYGPEAETPTTVYFNVNHVWTYKGGFNLWAADLPDDHYDGYLPIREWPKQEGDHYYWLIEDATERYPKKEYAWFITYDGKLPFRELTRKEYLDIKIPQLTAFLSEMEGRLKDIDPDFDAASKRIYDDALESIALQKKLIEDTRALLQSMSPEELNVGAIVYAGDSKGEFTGFRKAGEPYCDHLVKPDLNYYNRILPKWVPQFFCILFQLNTADPVYAANIQAIEKTIDVPRLKAMLGYTGDLNALPATQPVKSPAPVVPTTSAAPVSSVAPKTTPAPVSSTTKPAPAENKNSLSVPANKPSVGFDPSKPVYDLDSNQYTVIKMGAQYWLKENLRTSQYNDTTAIATGLSDSEWKETKKGAYAVYDNNAKNDQIYGKLYNGYAVATAKLCPKGWRIPTDKDWRDLEQYLGIPAAELESTGERGSVANMIKTADGWKESAFFNSNSTGFSVKPAGARLDNGEYTTLYQYANFWTSTVYDDRYGLLYLWNHHVHYNTHAVGRIYTLAGNGYSCRCIKEAEPVKP